MFEEYDVDSLNDIGCYVILDADEFERFSIGEMEFVEVIQLEEETYLHGVKILSDSYGEDLFLPIERISPCL